MGEGRVGVTVEQGRSKNRMHTVRIAKHIAVPEAQNSIPLSLDQRSSLSIALISVLPAVDFNHQPRAMTGEIRNERADRHLAAKASLRKALTKQTPQGSFGIGHVGAQFASASC
jgi:hypothetical protein